MTKLLIYVLLTITLPGIAQPKTPTQADTLYVMFKPVKNIAALSRTHPFLSKYLAGLKSEIKTMGTRLLSADLKSPTAKLFFLRLEGRLYAGTAGSGLEIYINQGNGFKPALSVSADYGIKVVDKADLTVIIPTGQGDAKWVLNRGIGKLIYLNP